MVILLLWLLGVRNIIATVHTAADIYKDLRLIHFIQRHCVRAWICITERAERSFFGTSQLYSKDMVLGKRNHFTIYNTLGEFSVYRLEFSDSFPFALQTENGKPEQRDLTKHERSASLNTKQERSVIGVVSRLEPIKGMDLVIPAFAEVRKRFPDVRLLVVGDGSLRGSMEQQAQELECADAVTWAGRQPQESLPQYYGEMDIVLMPSRSEGFGLTAIEAMACGCVVVASDVGGLPEVVRDGICGLLHRTEDVHDMTSKISSLIASSELYHSLQKNALQHVQKFSFQRYASAVCDLYERLIAT
jgi:glycosyltransferase involved in cell wall biosynthesis